MKNLFAALSQLGVAISISVMTFSAAAWPQTTAESLFASAQRKFTFHDNDGAIHDLTELIRMRPDFAPAYQNRGLAYLDKGEIDRAIQDFNEAIHLKPDYWRAFLVRCMAYNAHGERTHVNAKGVVEETETGDYTNAIQDCSEGIRLKPDENDLFYLRGTVYENKGEMEHAIQDFTEAIRLNPSFAEAFQRRGAVLEGRGDRVRAIRRLFGSYPA